MIEEGDKVVIVSKNKHPYSKGEARCEICGDPVYYEDTWPDDCKFVCKKCARESDEIDLDECDLRITDETKENAEDIIGMSLTKKQLGVIARSVMEEDETGVAG